MLKTKGFYNKKKVKNKQFIEYIIKKQNLNTKIFFHPNSTCVQSLKLSLKVTKTKNKKTKHVFTI